MASFDEAALLFAFACSIIFIVGYSLVAPWWKYEAGRAMVSLDFGLTLAELPGVLHFLFGLNLAHPFFGIYYACSLFSVGAIALHRLWVVWRIQNERIGR